MSRISYENHIIILQKTYENNDGGHTNQSQGKKQN